MKLTIRKRNLPEWLIYYILIMPFMFWLLMDVLQLPSLLKYTLDVSWIILLLCLLARRNGRTSKQTTELLIITIAFFALTLIGFLTHFDSALYYLWGLRNNLRFFVFFFACIFFIKARNVDSYFTLIDAMFWINIPILLYQYYVLGLDQDVLGGIFGTDYGSNGFTNVFMIIVVTRSIVFYLNGKESTAKCLTKCAFALVIATLAELKAFYLEFIVILFFGMKLTKFSWKKILLTIGAAIGIWVSIEMIVILFPQFAEWFSIRNIWESVTTTSGYTSHNDMNRLTTIPIAFERFLPTLTEKLFGLGLGNCDYSSFDFLTTPFYKMYGSLSYAWFSSAFLVLETGIVGLLLYVLFFVCIYFTVNRKLIHTHGNIMHCQISKILAVMCLILTVYDVSMRSEIAYLMYFGLAVPFITAPKASTAPTLRR